MRRHEGHGAFVVRSLSSVVRIPHFVFRGLYFVVLGPQFQIPGEADQKLLINGVPVSNNCEAERSAFSSHSNSSDQKLQSFVRNQSSNKQKPKRLAFS